MMMTETYIILYMENSFHIRFPWYGTFLTMWMDILWNFIEEHNQLLKWENYFLS